MQMSQTDHAHRALAERTLWVLYRDGRHAHAMARAWIHGIELTILIDDKPHWTQWFAADAGALSETAEMKRRAWAALGWSEHSGVASDSGQRSTP